MGHPQAWSRDTETQQIIRNCLQRLEQLVGESRASLFHKALYASGVTRDALRTGNMLSLTRLDQVLFRLRNDVPGITLELFSTLSLLDLGLVGYAAASAGTVGQALNIVNRYHGLTSDRFRPRMEVEDATARTLPVIEPPFASEFRDIAEDHLGGSWNLIRQLLGPAANPAQIEVRFAYSPPSYGSLYERVFCGRARFDEESTELVFPSAWLDLPVATTNPEIANLSAIVCERLLGPASRQTDTAAAVRSLLFSRPGRISPGVDTAARALGLSSDQLRKRLWRQGTSYKSLVLETRMMLGKNYLEATHLSVQEVAYLLDYSQPGAFSRAFKKYFGVAPMACRESTGGKAEA